MGIGMGRNHRYEDEDVCPDTYTPPPYIIRKRVEYLGYCVLKVWYRHATNCNGEKILVYSGQYKDIDQSVGLEPHFAERGGPVARFRPTQDGWNNAFSFVESLS